MPKTILISIHPEYAEKILTGEKTYELRRRLPLEKPDRMVIYATAPVSAVIGTAEVSDMIDLPLTELWKRVGKSAFVTLDEFHEYFRPGMSGFISYNCPVRSVSLFLKGGWRNCVTCGISGRRSVKTVHQYSRRGKMLAISFLALKKEVFHRIFIKGKHSRCSCIGSITLERV